jgi:hypothetical protein
VTSSADLPNSSSEPGLELWWCRWDGEGEGAAVERFEVTDEMVERLARHICGIPGDVDLEPTDEARARARRHLEVAFGAASGDGEWRAPLPCYATCEGLCFAWLPSRACRAATAAELAASSTQQNGGSDAATG